MEEILSVGIDIGTATTQVIFSKLRLENIASTFSAPQVNIIDKLVLYQSEIHSTPLSSPTQIDSESIKALVNREYQRAGILPDDVKTGAIIVTGETALKENAEAIMKELSSLAGDFVVYTAGPDLESIIAGKGSGAQAYSRKHACSVANLDIGGGTCNIAVFKCGELITCGTFDIGGRLIRLDNEGNISYISPRVKVIMEAEHVCFKVGSRADIMLLKKIVRRMNIVLEQVFGFGEKDNVTISLVTSGSSNILVESPIDFLCFSGGVADCIGKLYPDPFFFNDIGIILGLEIAEGLVKKMNIINPDETIRATVIGAGSHTLNISGSTIECDFHVLPLRNIPVLHLKTDEEYQMLVGDCDHLVKRMKWFLHQTNSELVAISFKGPQNPNFDQLIRIGESIAISSDNAMKPGLPIVIAIQSDIAKALGQQIKRFVRGARPIVCLDGIIAADCDYLDIGTPLLGGLTVPVVIKTLLFGTKGG